MIEIDDEGRLATQTTFTPDDLAAALATLHAEDAAEPVENGAWRASQAFRQTFRTRDWDALLDAVTDGFELDDRRSGVRTT